MLISRKPRPCFTTVTFETSTNGTILKTDVFTMGEPVSKTDSGIFPARAFNLASASTTIDNIKVRQFDWKIDGTHQDYGMIAQELVTVVPEAVSSGEKSTDMMGVDYSKLVPLLVKEIQELRQRVAQLEE